MRQLKKLISTSLELNIMGITDDSRLVKDGYLFVATKGYNVDHFDFIFDAIKKGCAFLIVDREINFLFPHIVVDNINSFYIELCKKYYDFDSDYFHLIGITGTDGKTTTASIVSKLIENCAYIGTNGLTIRNKTYPLSNTTPCISELYECFYKIKKANINTVVMEVSSESLLHDRVESLSFEVVAFTNITEDHLNVHKTFEKYLNSKLKLLDYVKDNGKIIMNNDDFNLCKIKCKNMYTFGKNVSSNYIISKIEYSNNITNITIKNKDRNIIINSPLFGKYNVYNVVEAFIISKLFVAEDILLKKIKYLLPIKGRGERLDFGQNFIIVLDYAHTINGVKNILEAYQNYDYIITVTGAAGGRDSYKRPIIGKMVMEKSNVSIFTTDDPRYEDVDDIIDDLVGVNNNYIRIQDREEAIYYALSIAPKNSVVLILGKGRDNYMAIEDKKISYNDYNVIKNYFTFK